MSTRSYPPLTDNAGANAAEALPGQFAADATTSERNDSAPAAAAAQSPLLRRHVRLLSELAECVRRISHERGDPQADLRSDLRADRLPDHSPAPADCRVVLTVFARWRRLDCSMSPRPAPSIAGEDREHCLCAADPLLAAEKLIQTRGGKMLDAAISTFCASEWQAGAQSLHQSCEELEDAGERAIRSRSELAERLLWELDDTELLLAVACRLPIADPARQRLAGQVMQCHQWVADHADDFLSAGEFAKAMLSLMRRDLPCIDPALAKTAVKYLHVLQALERMEEACSLETLPPLESHFAGQQSHL